LVSRAVNRGKRGPFSPILSGMRVLCLILLVAFLLPACGQKGPLYLPDQQPPKKERIRP